MEVVHVIILYSNHTVDDKFFCSYLCFAFLTSCHGKLRFIETTAKLFKKKYVARVVIKQQY